MRTAVDGCDDSIIYCERKSGMVVSLLLALLDVRAEAYVPCVMYLIRATV
jgi:hypothetical protein